MSTILIQKRLRIDGVLTNADSPPTLSDSAAVFGIKRSDTNAVVVAAGTVMTHDGAGLYSYSYGPAVAGVTYAWSVKMVVSGQTIYDPGTTLASSASASWNYADQPDLEDALGVLNVAIESNLENADTTANTARILRAGQWADAIMDSRLYGFGYTVPLAGMDAGTELILMEVSVGLVAWKLNDWRSIQGATDQKALDKQLENGRTDAMQQLARIGLGLTTITADFRTDEPVTAEAFDYSSDWPDTWPLAWQTTARVFAGWPYW